jgi:cell division protease FtsH
MKRQTKFLIGYLVAAICGIVATHEIWVRVTRVAEIPYSQFQAYLSAGQVEEIHVTRNHIRGVLKRGHPSIPREFSTIRVEPDLADALAAHDIEFSGKIESTWMRDLLPWAVPALFFAVLWPFAVRRLADNRRRGNSLAEGLTQLQVHIENEVKVTFADLGGIDQAKAELQDIIEFLNMPERFSRLGGKIPRGILLIGAPGTGKTMLAKAIAGEAGVPFFTMSGSAVLETFAGTARIHDLFEQAKQKAPCVLLVDELDALGKTRGMLTSGQDDLEQTLNQLLLEIEDYDPCAGMVLMAATNHPETLDPALLRAGRFDRLVTLDRPDKAARLEILSIHAKDVRIAATVNLGDVAAMTAGFTGADLATVINEAALFAVQRNKEAVSIKELHDAVERFNSGPEKSALLNARDKERIAYHEIGHAIIAQTLFDADAARKISLIPRGIAAYTPSLASSERALVTQSELENSIAVLLGGRVAEELVFHEPSTAARDDLNRATEIAHKMVKAYGMTDKLGKVSFDDEHYPPFGQTSRTPAAAYSDEIAQQITLEVRKIIDRQHARAGVILKENVDALHKAAKVLLHDETMSREELMAILSDSDCRRVKSSATGANPAL